MAAEDVKIYDLDQMSVSFGGQDLGSGWGEGAAIKFEKVKPNFTFKEGADGSVARSKTGSKLWKVTLTFLNTASANGILSAIADLDESNPNGAGVGPFFVNDLQGTTLFISAQSWLEGQASPEFTAEASNVEWVIYCGKATVNWGGN